MTRARLVIATLFLAAAAPFAAPSAKAQGIQEIQVDAAALGFTEVSSANESFALFEREGETYYAVSLDGGRSLATVRRQRPQLMLRDHRFDPLAGLPAAPSGFESGADQRLFLVQYHCQLLNGFDACVAATGAELLQVFPWQARLVRCDAAQLAEIATLPFVRWVGPYRPDWRLDRAVLDQLVAGRRAPGRYWIHVTRSGLEEKERLADYIQEIGGRPADYISPHGHLFEADLDAFQLRQLIDRDEVLFIDEWSAPENDLDIARQFGGADYVETMGGYAGQGVRGEVQDSGLYTAHPDYVTPALIHGGNSTDTSHGTQVYGVVFGTGLNNPQARGFLPEAQPVFHAYSAIVDRYVETGELLQAPYRCVFQTNSWGNTQTSAYTTISADIDNILFDHDIIVTQSQSNTGTTSSRPQAWAKNIVSVGGIRHYNTLTETDDAWANGASIGPAADGRLKPDISSFYDSTLAANNSGGYSNFSGTSNATPVTVGHFGLLFQMWADGIFGNPLVNWDVFDNKPHASTAKALMLNAATQYAFSGTTHDLTRVHQGWGRPDVKSLYDRRGKMQWIDQSVVLTQLQQVSYSMVVQPGEPDFRATLVYPDPAGNPAASVHRINDLTLKVTAPGGTIYWGNVGLAANNFSTAGGSANVVDTVEQVLIQNPAAGTWTVQVIATEVNQDGHVETGAVDADFSLVVTGVVPAAGPPADFGQANQSDAILEIRDALNLNGQKPRVGVNGPFFATLSAGEPLEFTWKGPVNRTFMLLFGALNRANEVFPGIGNLDVGLVGPGNYSDVQTLMNGLAPVSFFDLLANTGPAGSRTLSFTVPPTLTGPLGAFQSVFWDGLNNVIRLSAATEVTIN
ncbi:MAG: S8 family serine peptidase [Planctomycetes bacterium]|nr:S8 family serine peptidase [Planctomycetota bacterium]